MTKMVDTSKSDVMQLALTDPDQWIERVVKAKCLTTSINAKASAKSRGER